MMLHLKKDPIYSVHIKVSLDTMLARIKKRGRDYEQLIVMKRFISITAH